MNIKDITHIVQGLPANICEWLDKLNWGTVPDWFGAVGTIAAVIVALMRKKQKGILEVRAFCSEKRLFMEVDDPSGKPGKSIHEKRVTQFKIILSNIGDANLLVTSLEVEIKKNWLYDFALFEPVVVTSGDVKNLIFNGLGSKYEGGADKGIFSDPFSISVLEYVKANKSKLIVTSHDGQKTSWPIEIKVLESK